MPLDTYGNFPMLIHDRLVGKGCSEETKVSVIQFTNGDLEVSIEEWDVSWKHHFNDTELRYVFSLDSIVSLCVRLFLQEKESVTEKKATAPIQLRTGINLIIGDRGTGKSTRLIVESIRSGLHIVVATKERKEHLFRLAKDMHVNIPDPLTFYELKAGYHRAMNVRRVLIDDMESFITMLFGDMGLSVETATFFTDRAPVVINLTPEVVTL